MAIKPSPTIAGKLRKLFNNNKQTIEPAIGDSVPGGSGSGANVLTLYGGMKGDIPWCYKNPECTEEYSSIEEATAALNSADVIAVKIGAGKFFPVGTYADSTSAKVIVVRKERARQSVEESVSAPEVYLYKSSHH